jgi:hypothetical protein
VTTGLRDPAASLAARLLAHVGLVCLAGARFAPSVAQPK